MSNRKGNSRKGRTHLKSQPAIIAKVAADKAAGKPQRKIAQELQVSPSSVSRIANADETKALIEATAQTLIHHGMETAVSNIIDTIEQSKKAGVHPDRAIRPILGEKGRPIKDIDGETLERYDRDYHKGIMELRKESNRVGEGILKSVGLLPAHAPAIHIQAIININESNTLAPTVRGVVEHYTDDLVIDAEYSDDG